MEDSNQKKPLFEDNSQALVARNDAAAVARATQEIQAALVIAQRFPRDEIKAKAKIIEACQRKDLAELAEYEYSRGGTRITGPTIDLLRAIANRWGNIRFGWSEVERQNGQSLVRCFGWDLQSNGQAERTFIVQHWRDTQAGGYELTDERDIYELLANMAARRVRACLEEVIDADVVNAAIDQCRLTLKSGEKVPLADRAVKMLVPFAEFGVTQAMIETRLGNKLDAVSENQLASLRRVYKSLRDGVGKREDYFKPSAEAPNFAPASPPAAPEGSTPPGQAPPPPAAAPSPTPAPPDALIEAPVTTKSAPEPANNLKIIRQACKASKPVIREGVLLGFLAEIGLTDGSVGSLEELQMANPAVVEKVIAQWPDIRLRINEALKGGPGQS